MNQYEITNAFKACMAENGIITDDEIIADGQLHRFHINGHKSGSKNGAYTLHLDGYIPAGYFEDLKTGIKANWKANGPVKQLTEAEQRQIEQRRQKAESDRLKKQQRAAETARRLWDESTPVQLKEDHPYLIQKNVQPHNLRLLPVWSKRIKNEEGKWTTLTIKNVLLVPLINFDNQILNLQLIFPEKIPELGNRNKDFLPGGLLKGLFAVIGEKTPERLICEGWATGATLHQATGYQTFCAMSAGNLIHVGRLLRQHRPTAKIIIAADNDEKTPGNPGLKKATEAANAVNGVLCVPPIAGDFNDWANMEAK